MPSLAVEVMAMVGSLLVLAALFWVLLGLFVHAALRGSGGRATRAATAALGASLLLAPAWLSVVAVLWVQQSRGGRRALARLGLLDGHDGHDGRDARVSVGLTAEVCA